MSHLIMLIPAAAYTSVFILARLKIICKDIAAIIYVILIPISLVWLFLSAIFVFPMGL